MMWTDQRVLVTGGCGFIGSHLVEALVEAGAAVEVVDDLRSGRRANLDGVGERVACYTWDVGGEVFLNLVRSRSFDCIFALASNSYVPPSVTDPWGDFNDTLVNVVKLLEVLRTAGSRARLILASSAAVYGNPVKLPASEEDPTVPISPYGVAKLAAERYVHVYSQLYGLRGASLRLFSVYGPRQTKQVVYDLMGKLEDNPTELHVLGDGQQVRDMTYVKDVVRAALLVAERGALAGEVYNVASQSLCTIEELARMIAQAMDREPTIAFDRSIAAGRLGDPRKWSADTQRLAQIGFEPTVSLEVGLCETAAWFRSRPGR